MGAPVALFIPSEPMRVSVILAAHNEAPTIADVVTRCRAASPDVVEVLVVDDGSSDGTGALAEAAGARVLTLSPNRGKGVALRHGIDHATGDALVFLDADGQDDPAEMPALLAPLRHGADLVIGSRFLGTFERGAITALNEAGTHLLNAVFNVLFDAHITDCLAGYRAARAASLRRFTIAARRYDIEVDILIGVLQTGGHVIEVPVRRMPRLHGSSDLRSFRDGTRILLCMLRKRLEGGRTRLAESPS